MQPRAWVYCNKDRSPDPLWPGIQIKSGLEKAGFENRCKYADAMKTEMIYPFDLLLCWTLWQHVARTRAADVHAKIGGTVLCSENGFLRKVGDKRYFQLAKRVGKGSGINGQGRFPIGDDSRWKEWNLPLKPWRTSGDYVLVCAQRGAREDDPLITHGRHWPDDVIPRIRKYTDRPIWFRPHPGNKRPCLPQKCKVDRIIDPHEESLEQNLSRAWACVVYTSTSATDAIVNGVPVCFDGPAIMCQDMAGRIKDIEKPPMPEREEIFADLAWGQWNLDELSSGRAFSHVLELG